MLMTLPKSNLGINVKKFMAVNHTCLVHTLKCHKIEMTSLALIKLAEVIGNALSVCILCLSL